MTRAPLIDRFLAQHDLGQAARAPLAGDASARRYLRVAGRILMDAPPERGEDIRPFLRIAAMLRDVELSVPEIEASDPKAGLILMEDLGDRLYSTVTAEAPDQEAPLYLAATDAIARMQTASSTDLPNYTQQMPDLACLAIDWYAPAAAPHRDELAGLVATALERLQGPEVFVHRDFHADNLLWLPARTGVARVGLLDFQDAMAGPAEYDLASLLHDARRVVSPGTQAQAMAHWAQITGRSQADIALGFATCSVQRGLRILGVFTRLCLRDGKAHYPDFIPRTWALLQEDLAHPGLRDLARLLAEILPAPTQARLADIRARIGQGHP